MERRLKRDFLVSVYLTGREAGACARVAKSQGVSVSSWARGVLTRLAELRGELKPGAAARPLARGLDVDGVLVTVLPGVPGKKARDRSVKKARGRARRTSSRKPG